MDLQAAVGFSILSRTSSWRFRGSEQSGPVRPRSAAACADVLRRLATSGPQGAALSARINAMAGRALARAEALGIRPLTLDDPLYPAALATLGDAPPVLWVRGAVEPFASPAIAIVGARSASPYGLQVADALAAELGRHGVLVVSGLARGIDAAAHRGALSGGGVTAAVLGCGADLVYPGEHEPLVRKILERGGAIVSELPPGTPPRKEHFPQRNRIISGLVLGVVVVEGSVRSGSLITARCALDQGREVMAVPGNIFSDLSRGPHGLLKDGAKLVESVSDVLEELPVVRRQPEHGGRSTRRSADVLLRQMTVGEAYEFGELAERSGIEGTKLLARLLELELDGSVSRVAGGRFVRTGGGGNVT